MWYPAVAPSAVRSPREPTRPRALSEGEIDAIIEGFRASAVNVAQAGFQVVELHAAHGYLLAQFLSSSTNLRPCADSLTERTQVVRRIAEAIRRSVPNVILRHPTLHRRGTRGRFHD
jgi:2,4-dienoyl-CoA reductase (NADPH2)